MQTNPTTSEIPSECLQAIKEFKDIYESHWKKLITQYRDLDCKDFCDSRDANLFYNWISGEMMSGFYIGSMPKNCHYDPYGLDSDGDCDPCEELK